MVNCYYFKETLLYVFMEFSFKSSNSNLLYFLTTNVAEVFITYIELSYYIASYITLIFIYYQIFVFLSAGLYVFEYVYFKTILNVTTVL